MWICAFTDEVAKELDIGETHGKIKNKPFRLRAIVPFDRKNPKAVIDGQNEVKQ